MAHFAELNSSSVVLQVVVISNEDVAAHGGDESTTAEDFVETLVPFTTGGTSWKQTSYNNSFRKQYAGIGYTYDKTNDVFVSPQPFASWTLDASFDWQPPTAMPDDGNNYTWNEKTKAWDETD